MLTLAFKYLVVFYTKEKKCPSSMKLRELVVKVLLSSVPHIIYNYIDGHGDISLNPATSLSRPLPPALHPAQWSFVWVDQKKQIIFCGGRKYGETDPTTECSSHKIGNDWAQAGLVTNLPDLFYAGAHADLGNGRHWIGGGTPGTSYETKHVLITGQTHKVLSPPLSQIIWHYCAARLPDFKVSINDDHISEM